MTDTSRAMSVDIASHSQVPLPSPPPQQQSTEVPPPLIPTTSSVPPIPNKLDATPQPAPESPDFVTVPSYSSWFRWDAIHESEVRYMQEFFDGKSSSKNPSIYKYYRDAIINKFRSNPSKKLTFTEVRRTIVGDVGSIRRVFDFLDTWGLINYSPPSGKPPFKWEDKDKDKDRESSTKTNATTPPSTQPDTNARKNTKLCSACKVACTIASFVSDKYDLVLCARCYVRGNYQVGVNSTEFRRVEISEQVKTNWTDKETLHLVEAVLHYRDDWKHVAEHVGGRTEKECVARFINLPFQEQFMESTDLEEDENMSSKDQVNAESVMGSPAKRMRLTPLADASNPIMAQAAFLSALAGLEVSEAAARAAVANLYEMDRVVGRSSGHLRKVQGIVFLIVNFVTHRLLTCFEPYRVSGA
ncbi:unnamed protein product [Amaranthus hypochondriacus]